MVGGQYKPVDIAQYALFQYGRLKAGYPEAETSFLNQARYLMRAQRPDGSYIYETPVPEYGAGPCWSSAMAQGEAISVLLRAWLWTGDDRFKAAAQSAAQPLCLDTRHGGVAYLRNGDVFFEEVATPDPCHILNGHLFAAFGIWELLRVRLGNELLRNIFAASLETLSQWITLFDAEAWSYYDLAVDTTGARHLALLLYHNFHIAQLRVFAAMTGNAVFDVTASRWESALASFAQRVRLWSYGARVVARALLKRLGVGGSMRWMPMPIEAIGEAMPAS
jgi:heparosan-N-sulfate-glucuronate 5-epimerase